jgi:hypothetical protein
VLPNSKPCPDTGNECAEAGCNGAGQCDQSHVASPDSTPCEDTDGRDCTIAGCSEAGTCDQEHISNCFGGCRVTGGGKVTDTFPPIVDSTHGGQVGSPIGVATVFDPDSACIAGEWEHVRHNKQTLPCAASTV